MDDLPHLISMLTASPPPLSLAEQEIIEKVRKALDQNGIGESDEKEKCVPPEFISIQEPQPLTDFSAASQISTVFESQNLIYVGPQGHFPTIAQAVAAAQDNSTIVIQPGTYTEDVTFTTNLHIVGQSDVKCVNCHFTVKSQLLTIRSIAFTTQDSEIFTLSRGQLSLLECRIESSANKPPFDMNPNVSLEIVRCAIAANIIMQARMSVLSLINSHFLGSIAISKSDINIINCKLDGRTNIALELYTTNMYICGSIITGSNSVGISVRERSNLTIESTNITEIRGAGILVHSSSIFKANNIRINNCEKSGVIISNDSNVEISESKISHCKHTGCEVLNTGSLELNGVWISETNGSGVLCDGRAKFSATRCRITNGSHHGIEAGNGASVNIRDTMIDGFKFSGVVCSNAKVTATSCLLESNFETNMTAEDHSWVEITYCSFLKSKQDGLVADSEAMIICTSCYFIENQGKGVIVRNCRDSKFQQSTFFENAHGGLLFEDTKQMVIDNCVIKKNSFIVKNVSNAMVRLSLLNLAFTKYGDEPREFIEILNQSKATFEECRITSCCTKVRKSEANLRQNKFSKSQQFAIIGEYCAKLFIESNEFDKDRQILSIKDNSYVHFFNNKISNVLRPFKKDPNTNQKIKMGSEYKIKAIHIKSFSQGLIEGNTISGDYDYAIFVDGQSKVDNRANQIQCGPLAGICYSGVSSGLCEDNQYTGTTQHNEFFQHGCSPTRK